MLQPSQIDTVSLRYPAEIAEVRGFLRGTGISVDTVSTLQDVVRRLAQDSGFHRDLGSHVWMLLFGGATVPETLGVLAVAAAGPRYASSASEDAAHALLRFVLESRNAMASEAVAPVAGSAVPPVPPIVEPVERAQAVDAPAPTPIREERIAAQRPTAVYTRAALRAITPAIAVEHPVAEPPAVADVELPARAAAAPAEVRERGSRRGLYAAIAACLLACVGAGAWYLRHTSAGTETVAQPAPIVERTADMPATRDNAPVMETPQPGPEAYVPGPREAVTKPSATRASRYSAPSKEVGRSTAPEVRSNGAAPYPTATVNASPRTETRSEEAATAPAPVIRVAPPASLRGTTPVIPSAMAPAKVANAPVSSAVLAGRLGSPVVNQADAVDDRVAGTKGYPRLLRRKPLDTNGTLMAKASPVDVPGARGVSIPSGTVRSTSLGITAGNLVYAPDPSYPAAAAVQHISGQVKLEAMVDREGNVASARVISGPPMLRDAAVSAVQQWRYRPFTAGGKPQTFTAMAVVDFQLQ